ncbi:MAG: DUF1844 domain-containing protein [Acidobacteria bacterium]|nr:MAG: DUF1844 domain-containing protein [Acidobacteriota bacterium]PYV64435.1 MAG: DUF1844 domain-containing protein [Acidobacteriota bacterium]
MAERKNESFTVTDRRLFTSDGELRKDVPEEKETPAPAKPSSTEASAVPEANEPPPPSTDEQNEQARAYEKSSAEMDRQAELSGISTKEMEITFERFLASLYMTGMLQLGLMHQQGAPPQLDLIGARQTIDSLSLLSDKTKGNLSSKEQSFLQNALYELRMAYVEVTNAIAKGAKQVPAAK